MDESRLECRFKREVERYGGCALKFAFSGKRGMPDRIILFPGAKIIFVEIKAPGKKLTPLQLKRAAELRALGFPVYCVDSTAAVNNFIKEVMTE